MRFVVGIAAVLLVAWTGWWFFASSHVERVTAAFLTEKQADGMEVAYDGVDVTGFPYRFDLNIANPDLFDPASGIGWRAPFLRAQALAYQPNHIIATLPDSQTLTLRNQTLGITSTRMQGSLRTSFPPRMALNRLVIETEGGHVASDLGWALGLPKAVAGLQASGRPGLGAHGYDLSFQSTGITPEGALRDRIDPRAQLPATIEAIRLDASVGLDAALERAMFNPPYRQPEIQQVVIRDAGVTWGSADLRLAGDLAMDGAGLANGTLRLKVKGWETILNLVVSLGLVPEENRRVAELALRVMARTKIDEQTLDVPLQVTAGTVFLGPLPLTTIPPVLRQPGTLPAN